MRLEVNKEKLEDLRKRVRSQLDIIRNASKQKDVMAKVATIMYKSVMQNFKEEGTDKEKWVRLSPLTILARERKSRKKGGIHKILQDSGMLRTSIIPKYDGISASVGTNLIYARIHQFGGRAGKNRKVVIPKRPFLVLREVDKRKIIELIQSEFRKRK